MAIKFTEEAFRKALEIMAAQNNPKLIGLRVAVIGGGCSGFQYHMAFEAEEAPKEHKGTTDSVFEFGDGKLKVFVDQMSLMYLDGIEIDYVETLEGYGFKFTNPNVKSTCGCGQSFTS